MGDSNRHNVTGEQLYDHLADLFGIRKLPVNRLVLEILPREPPKLTLEMYVTGVQGKFEIGPKGPLTRCQTFTLHPIKTKPE